MNDSLRSTYYIALPWFNHPPPTFILTYVIFRAAILSAWLEKPSFCYVIRAQQVAWANKTTKTHGFGFTGHVRYKKLSYRIETARQLRIGWLTDRAMHRTPQNRRGCIIFWHSNALIQDVLAENGFWHEIATQGHSRSFVFNFHFAISYRPTRGCIACRHYCLPYLWSFQNCRRRQPHSHLTPPPRGTPANIRMHLIFPETRIIGLHFLSLIVWSIFSHICTVCSKCIHIMQHHLSDILRLFVICIIMKALNGLLIIQIQMTLKVYNAWKLHRPHVC